MKILVLITADMSNFGNHLSELLAQKKLNQSDLSRLTKISQAHISKLISGTQTWVSSEDLDKLCSAVTSDKHEQAELIRSHLLDECHGPGSDLIDIRIGKKSLVLKEEAPNYKTAVPTEYARHLEILSNHADDKQLRIVIKGLAAMYEKAE